MDVQQIERMSLEELDEFLGLGSDGHICREPGCYNECESGLVVCIHCNHGKPERAHENYVAAKKRLVKLRRAAARERATAALKGL